MNLKKSMKYIYILVLKKTLKCEIEQTCNKEITNFLKTNSDY